MRNPWPFLLNIALPIVVTAVIGFAFAPRGGESQSVPRIKLAIVDEDQSMLSSALRAGVGQGDGGKFLDPLFTDRPEALRELRENQISAILIIPTNFTSKYLQGESGLKLEVIKNPAQTYLPAIVEELAGVVVTGLNAVSRNLNSEFPKMRAAFTNGWALDKMGESIKQLGDRLDAARAYLDPPLVSYQKAVTEKKDQKGAKGMSFNIFGFILPGMASAFLLFLADQSMRDFHREVRMKTLDRQRIAGAGVWNFIVGKTLFTAFTALIGAAILFGGGTLIFGVDWGHPGLLALACAGYSLFAAGFLAMLTAMAPSERRADVSNSMLLFGVAFLGGSYVPSDNFPAFMREYLCPLMPNYWLIQAARALQNGASNYAEPLVAVAKLAALGAVLAVIASLVLERRLTSGARA